MRHVMRRLISTKNRGHGFSDAMTDPKVISGGFKII
jgi:hypothetical protein